MSDGSDIIRRAIAAFNAGDLQEYFAHHSSATTLEQPDGAEIDRDTYVAQTQASRARWPSLTVTIARLHDAGAVVVMESTVDLGDGTGVRPEAVIFDLSPDGLIDHTRIYARESIEMTLADVSWPTQ